MKLLIIDDEAAILKQSKRSFGKKEGYSTFTAESAGRGQWHAPVP